MDRFDVVGIGNAIVDLLVTVDLSVIEELGLEHGAMTLIDDATSERLTSVVGTTKGVSGGSAANTVVGIAALGGKAALVATIADDLIGAMFVDDLRAAGVAYVGPEGLKGGPGTGRCLVLVTPGGERTMGTFLGASGLITSAHLDKSVLIDTKVLYLEGYLSDAPDGYRVLRDALRLGKDAGVTLALTLSDAFCVERHRELLVELASECDIVFANESEAMLMSGGGSLEATLSFFDGLSATAAITLGSRGSVIVSGDERVEVPVEPVASVVDLTGAGDLYAAGFLHGWTRGADLAVCGRLGSIAAGEIISHLGARPQRSLHAMIEDVALRPA